VSTAAVPSVSAAAAPDVTIVNTGSAEYHARQLVRVIKGEKWDDWQES
jgi:ribose 1,5-bisphosphokinase